VPYFAGSSRGATGGFHSGLFKGIKRLGAAALAASPLGTALSVGRSFFPKPSGAIPLIATGGRPMSATAAAAAGLRPKRRRMNVTNDKALRRAIRRTDGFIKLAKRALKNTDSVIVSKSSLAVARAKKKVVADIHHAE